MRNARKLQEDRTCTESVHEVLVDNPKDKLCRIIFNSHDEQHVEVDDIKKK